MSDYSVEDDLRGIFKAVLGGYEQMKREARLTGEPEELLRVKCRQSMKEMRTIYQENLPTQTRRVDYTNLVTRWSYMYLYMLRHIHLTYCALKKGIQGNILRVKPNDAPLDICMIGGGPGSDILGICLLMKEYRCQTPWTNQVSVLDACTDWEYSWNKMYHLLPQTFRQGVPEVKYCLFNYRDNDLSTSNQQRIKNADMVTMIKSLSSAGAWLQNQEEVYENYRSPSGTLQKKLIKWHSVYSILKHMKPGAIFLYLDNKKGWQREILMKAAKNLKFDVLLDTDLQNVRMPLLNLSPEFLKQMEWKPCRTAVNNEMILLRKPGYLSNEVKLEVTVPNQSLLKEHQLSQSVERNDAMYDHSNRVEAEYAKNVDKTGTVHDHAHHNSCKPSQTSVAATRLANSGEGMDGVRKLARYNFRPSSQRSFTKTRGAKTVKGVDGVRNLAPNNFKPSSQTPCTATRGVNTMKGVDGVRNLARYNFRPSSQRSFTKTRGATTVKDVDGVRNLARYNSIPSSQRSFTKTRGATTVEGVDGVRNLAPYNLRPSSQTSFTATRGAKTVKGVDRVRNLAPYNFRPSSQRSFTKTRGAKTVKGLDGVRNLAPNNFKPSSQTSFTATRGVNTMKGVDRVQNLARYNFRPSSQRSFIKTRLAKTVKDVDGFRNLAPNNFKPSSQTSFTATRKAKTVKGVDGVRNLAMYNLRPSSQTSITAKRGAKL